MKIKCIDTDNCIFLTCGKIYETVVSTYIPIGYKQENDKYCFIIDDSGTLFYARSILFIDIVKLRNNKISTILDEDEG